MQPAQPSQWSRKTPLYTCIYLIQSVVATGAAVAMVAKDVFIYMYIFNTECGCNRRSRHNGRERRLYIHVYISYRVWLQPAQPSQWSRKTPLYTCIYLIQSVVATGAAVAMVAKDVFIYMYIFNTECGCNRRSRHNGRERRLYIRVYI